MKCLRSIHLIIFAIVLSGCAAAPERSVPAVANKQAGDVHAPATKLLVNLEDGSVIMQTIDVGADLCFKNNSESATTCLTRGAAILDPETDRVIAYEMVEKHIDLVATSR